MSVNCPFKMATYECRKCYTVFTESQAAYKDGFLVCPKCECEDMVEVEPIKEEEDAKGSKQS